MLKRYLLYVFLLSISLFLTAGNAQALSFTESAATLYINTLTITTSGDVSLDDYYSYESWGGQVKASNNLDDEDDDGPNFGDDVTAEVTGAYAEAKTPSVGDDLSGYASASVSTPGLHATAEVLSELWLGTYYDNSIYYYYGEGTIDITIEYMLELEMGTDIDGEWAEGYASAMLQVIYNNDSFWGDPDDDVTVTDLDFISGSVADESDYLTQTITGTLSISIDVNGDDLWGGCLYIDGLVANTAEGFTPVPEPATMLLLGSGLAGLAGFRRRRR